MQHHWDHRCLQAGGPLNRQIHRLWRFRLNPVTPTAERAVCTDDSADLGAEGCKGSVAVRALHDGFKLGAMLLMVGERRQRHRRIAGIAVT